MSIVYTHTGSSSFVQSDLAIFQDVDKASDFSFTINEKWKTPFVFIKQLLFLLGGITKTKLYICQFAGYHSFLPALFAKFTGKGCLIISGGTDCVSYPGINYGNFNKGLLGMFTAWSFKLATHLAPKHETLLECEYNYDRKEPSKQGIKAFIPELHKPFTVIHNGYNAELFKPEGERIPDTFITLCGGWQFPFQEQLKGIDLILEVAPHFPQCQFVIAGVPEWKKLNFKSSNISTLPPVKNADLPRVFSQYEFYMQLSMAEGFPNALCEAMLCGCVPIVSDVFSMPEIIGDCGFVLKERNVNQLKDLLKSITVFTDLKERSSAARNRVIDNYGIEKRTFELQKLIRKLLNKE